MTELDLLPEEWEVVRLGEVAEQRKETTNPRDGDWKYVGLEHIDPGESHLKRYGFSNEVRSSKSKFYSGDILYGKLRPYLDKGVLVDFEGICSTDIIVIKTKENLNGTLLSYLVHIKDFRAYATKTMTGVNHPRTSWRTLSQFSISLPPLPEQQKIAEVLSTVQQAKEMTDTVISATKELKKSLMKHLFTYGPVPVNEFNAFDELGVNEVQNAQNSSNSSNSSNSKNSKNSINLKETEIGLVPEEWEVVRLGDVCKTKTGGTPSRQNPSYYNGDIPWVKSGELKDNAINYTDEKIAELGLKNSSAKLFPAGTLLIALYGATVGKTGILNIKASTNQAICAIFTDETFLSTKFLRYYFVSAREKLLEERYGGAQPNISQTVIRNTKIPLPPLIEQQKIANILSAVDKKIESEATKKKALEGLFKTLLNNLMTAKIRVKMIW